MNNRNILLISSGATFMVNAINMNLTKENFNVIPVAPEIEALNEHKDDANIYLFYLGDFIDGISEFLVYLKDLCIEDDKVLCLIGDHEEFSVVEKSIPAQFVKKKFGRPLDIKQLVSELEEIALQNDELMRRKNILLVDDDGVFLKMMRSWLEVSYRVTIVNSGMQAITYLATNTPDLILLDYEMPVTDGPQVLEMIRSEARTASIPVIFLTGKSDRESVMKVMELKPNGYLLKTMDRESILAAVAKHFESRKYQ